MREERRKFGQNIKKIDDQLPEMYCKEIAKEVDLYFAETKEIYGRRLWEEIGDYLSSITVCCVQEEDPCSYENCISDDFEAGKEDYDFLDQTLEHFLKEEESGSFCYDNYCCHYESYEEVLQYEFWYIPKEVMIDSVKKQLEDCFDLQLSDEEAEHLVEDYGDPFYVECAAFGMFGIIELIESMILQMFHSEIFWKRILFDCKS